MIRALAFAAIVGGTTWISNLYDRDITRTTERKDR